MELNNKKLNNNLIEYFLNAILYCLWLYKIGHNKNLFRFMTLIISPLSHKVLSNEQSQKIDKKFEESKKVHEKFIINKKNGLAITSAENLLFYAAYSYLLMFAFLIWGIIMGISDNPNPLYGILCVIIAFIIYTIVAHKLLLSNKKYLKYFEIFKNEGEQWHKKWNRATILFCFGGLFSFLLGCFLMVLIAIWLTD